MIGKNVYIRGRFSTLGRVTDIAVMYITVEDAYWVADTGVRHGKWMREGIAPTSELEYSGKARIPVSDISDILDWPHPLPMVDQPYQSEP